MAGANVKVWLVPNETIAFDFNKLGIIIEYAIDSSGKFTHAIHVFQRSDYMEVFMDHCESVWGECLEFDIPMSTESFLQLKKVFSKWRKYDAGYLLELIHSHFQSVMEAYTS